MQVAIFELALVVALVLLTLSVGALVIGFIGTARGEHLDRRAHWPLRIH